MRGEPRNSERADPPVDWMAEFTDEEPHDSGELRHASDEDAPPLIDLPLHPTGSDDDVGQARLIPLPPSPEPVVAEPLPPPHRPPSTEDLTLFGTLERAARYGLSVRQRAIAGLSAVAVVAGTLLALAIMWQWNRVARNADPAIVLDDAPAPPSALLTPTPTPPALPPVVSPVVSALPLSAKAEVAAKRPAPTKPQSSAAPRGGRATTTAPPRAASSTVPPLLQGMIDRKRAASSGTSAAPNAPTQTPTPTPTPTARPTSTPTLTPVTAPPPATLVVAPPVATLGTPVPTAPPAAPPPAPDERAIHTAAIQTVLGRYRLAFSTLSVDGLATVWRSVDTKALAKAFSQLEKQTVEFTACRIDINGDLAEALCNGRASFVPKIGDRTLRVETRQWTFRLVRVRGGWVIDRVDSR